MKFIEKYFEESEKIYGLKGESIGAYINYVFETSKKDIVLITNSIYEATELFQIVQNYEPNSYFFPMDEFFISDIVSSSHELKTTRIETLNSIITNKKQKILVTNLMGTLKKLPKKTNYENNFINLKKGLLINKEELEKNIYDIGYEKTDIVNHTGEYASRGFILDVFSISDLKPIRIEFFGDEIESIRYFDLDSQRTLENVEKINIFPFKDFSEEKSKTSILEYLDEPIVFYKDYDQIKNSYLKIKKEIIEYNLVKDINDFFEFKQKDKRYINEISNHFDKNIFYNIKEVPIYNENFSKINEDFDIFLNKKHTIVICLNKKAQINNFKNYIEKPAIITSENNIYENQINIINKKIEKGFIFENYVILNERNLFNNRTLKQVYKSNFRQGTKIKDIEKLSVGDYIVHNIHGIGKYNGIISINKNDIIKDYLQLIYKNNEKLYIPVEKIDMVSKYSSKEGYEPKINKLGGTEWQKTKLRVRKKIKDISKLLLEIYAQREKTKGFKFEKDTKEQLEFEKEFVYEETKDQLLTTEQIKKDMEKSTPMDRLLCGDVGYGKTEVAFRAAFKAICNSKQVAYLCPTTILSNQQYENAVERFKSYPINIELLNRFTPIKKVEQIKEKINKKQIDILFGTHRILSDDIVFKDLGLLIIDEEQRFGVLHKEKIKKYKNNIDVLTLSATPIPRTLQMSMVGLRNLSLIETPPINRYPIQTYVLEENDYIIRDAIYKELSRKGQIFVLYNNIKDIEKKLNELKKIVPEAKIKYAHGQMKKNEIEDIMIDFINQKFDILLCTTIIETGIDIPNVNTLIILEADKLGLSQLYQIRGRVGRTNKIAYAYLMYNKNKVLSTNAIKRLDVIKEFTELGSGFSIAIKDLSIRGAGDVLGSEQSGFIDSVGIDLYLKMLRDEIDEKEEQLEEKPIVEVDTHIEDSYVSDESLKIHIHKLINEINSYEKLDEVRKELEDRFGKINEKINIYMHQELFEKISKEKIEKINQTRNSIEITLSTQISKNIKINDLFEKSQEITKMFRFKYLNNKILIILDIIKLEKHWIFYLLELFKNI